MKLLYGVGVNDADYVVQKFETLSYIAGKQKKRLIWRCPFYQRWHSMIQRCYGESYHIKFPTYVGCTVCKEWLTFSVFKAWMEKQDWEGNQLDKDILFPGNKIYSAETCVFVSSITNNFIVESAGKRGRWPIGASFDKKTEKFKSLCNNPFTKKQEYLGLFATPEDAHQVWRERKLELAKLLAEWQSDPRVAQSIVHRYENYEV